MILFLLTDSMWSKETPDKYCKNNTSDEKRYSQLACQKLCEADSRCVGIAFNNQIATTGCSLCQDNILSNYYKYSYRRFYRGPGNGEIHSICFNFFINVNIRKNSMEVMVSYFESVVVSYYFTFLGELNTTISETVSKLDNRSLL